MRGSRYGDMTLGQSIGGAVVGENKDVRPSEIIRCVLLASWLHRSARCQDVARPLLFVWVAAGLNQARLDNIEAV